MGLMQNQCYLMSIQTSDSNILCAWNWLVNMLTLAGAGSVKELHKYLGPIFWKKFTTTTILPGTSDTKTPVVRIKIYGSSEKDQLLHFLVKRGLLEALWEKYLSLLKEPQQTSGLTMSSTLRCMEQAVSWVAQPPLERLRMDELLRKGELKEMSMMPGCKEQESKCEVVDLMNHLTATNDCPTC